jgi:hypothetical protein
MRNAVERTPRKVVETRLQRAAEDKRDGDRESDGSGGDRYDSVVQFRVLGQLEHGDPQSPTALGTPRQRAVLAILLRAAGGLVTDATLIDGVWGEEPPGSVRASIPPTSPISEPASAEESNARDPDIGSMSIRRRSTPWRSSGPSTLPSHRLRPTRSTRLPRFAPPWRCGVSWTARCGRNGGDTDRPRMHPMGHVRQSVVAHRAEGPSPADPA